MGKRKKFSRWNKMFHIGEWKVRILAQSDEMSEVQRGHKMKAFQVASKLDEICRNCQSYDVDMEIGGMYGICKYVENAGFHGKRIVKEANQYCDEMIQ